MISWPKWGTEEIVTRASIARLLPDLAASRTETKRLDVRARPRRLHTWAWRNNFKLDKDFNITLMSRD